MPDIKITLDTSKYQQPTEEDIDAAKQYVLEREETAQALGDRIDELLAWAAALIIAICYKYNVKPTELLFTSDNNPQMMEEIAEVMDELEERIFNLINEYATRCTSNKTRLASLTAWMTMLGRGRRDLRQTLHGYLYKTMKDWEAAIASLLYSKIPLSTAITKIKTHLHSIYTMPEVISAFKYAEKFAATYIRKRGVQEGAVGISNNGSTNVVNMAKITLQKVWMMNLTMEYEENGVYGIYILRGSNYPCEMCDDAVGFYEVKDAYNILPIHPHCMCFAVPIYSLSDTLKQYEI